jgi:hypothetical protein
MLRSSPTKSVTSPQGGNSEGANPGRFRSGQAGTHALTERGLDNYPTPPIAVESLLNAEPDLLHARVWEPAAGAGNIVVVLRKHRIPVIASDIEQNGFDLHDIGDFLKQERPPNGCRTIITNPPYRLAAEFAEHALSLVPDVFLLLRLAFLESVRRTRLLEHSGLRRVLVFRRRLARMHRQGWAGPKASSSMAFAWFCWRRNYAGPTILSRI